MPAEIKQFLDTIKKLIPISDLSPSAQNDVVEFAKLLQFKEKKFIFKEGDRDNYSYYILEGELELIANKQVQSKIISGSDNARYAIAQLQPRQFSAKAKTPVTILKLDRDMLDRLMVHEGNQGIDASGADIKIGVSDIEEEESSDWMTKILQSRLFARLPMANIQQMFVCLDAIEFNVGDTVIKQGELGDYYYIIGEGDCEVTRVPEKGESPIKLSELSVGDAFGEEALLTGSTRNSTVTMLSKGLLMRLNKDHFMNLIKKPLSSPITFKKAKKLIDEGGKWLDVRFAKEYTVSNIETSTNIPLNILRFELDQLNIDIHYVVYCDTGSRSSAAAFVLMQEGFNVSYLEGGLVSNHQISLKGDASVDTTLPKAQEKDPKKTSEKISEEVAEKLDQTIDSVVDPAVKASILEAELAKNKIDLEKSEKKQKQQSKVLDEEQKKANQAERKKLEQEKIEIEKQKKLADEEAKKRRKKEEERIKKFEEETKVKIQKEKKKLEDLYAKNTNTMKKLQEEKDRKEAEAKKVQEQKNNAKAAEQKQIKQTELEKKAETKARNLLEKEKNKLVEKVIQLNEELENVRQEKIISEAGRDAAKKEAVKIVNEYKIQSNEDNKEIKDSFKAKGTKLEKEAQQIKDKLYDIRRNIDLAKAEQRDAKENMVKLQAKQAKNITQGNDDKSLKEEIRCLKDKIKEATRVVEDAQHEKVIAKTAQEENMADILKHKAEEEGQFNKQMAAELNNWEESENKKQKQFIGKESQAESIRRITERAEAAKENTGETIENLFSEISSQISDDSHRRFVDK